MNKEQENSYDKVNINYYPGHMVKAQNEIKSLIKLIDIVVEVLDARIPFSSRNKIVEEFANGKKTIIVLNKSDLADDNATNEWIKYFKNNEMECIAINSSDSKDIALLVNKINEIGKSVYEEKVNSKSYTFSPIYKVLIAGIPNVGKSTIINKIAGRTATLASNKPGVTVRNKWIRVGKNIELLDTPGLLWPKLDGNAGNNLALTGNIKQEVIDVESLACYGIEKLIENEKYKKMFLEKYKLDEEDICNVDSYDILEMVGRKRGAVISGGNIDMEKASRMFLDDFKSGKIGKITIEEVKEETI